MMSPEEIEIRINRLLEKIASRKRHPERPFRTFGEGPTPDELRAYYADHTLGGKRKRAHYGTQPSPVPGYGGQACKED